MADKTVNVNIKYNVDTSSLLKAQTLSQQAQTATDNLRKSSDQFAKQFATNNVKSTDTIAGLTLKMQQLKAQIELTSLTDAKRLATLSGQYKAIQNQVDTYNKSLLTQSKATKDVSTNTQNLGNQFKEVYNAIKLILAAGLVKELITTSLEMAKLAGNVEGVERAFNRAFPGAAAILTDLREATHGTVSDFELMQRTLQATNLGVSVEHLGVLFEFAATRAQQTGESVDYLVDSIVRGIGRKSLLILDNLGLSAVRLKEQFDGASLASKSVADVTAGVAEIAKIELAKMGGFIETSATQVDQLTVSWKELKEEIAKALTEGPAGGLAGFLKSYTDSFKSWIEAHNRGIDVSEVFAEKQRIEIANISANEFINRRFTKSKEENIKILEEEITVLTKQIGAYASFRDMNESVVKDLEKQRKEATSGGLSLQGNVDLTEIHEQIQLRKRLTDSKKEDALIDQEILKLLQGRLMLLKQVNKEEKVLEDRSLVTDKVALFDMKVIPKKGLEQKALEQQLVDVAKMLQEAADRLKPVQLTVQPYIPPYQDSDLEKAWEANKDAVLNSSMQNFQDNINSTLQLEADAYSERLHNLRNFYDEQQILAGDNKRAKDQLRLQEEREVQTLEKRRADREKKAAQAGILVNTALAIIKIFAGEGTYVDKLIRAGIMAGEGATQYAIASRARYYAKGEINIKGPGNESSDSIPAMLSKGESIMTAKQTREAFGILTDVRAGKLNDRVLKQLVTNGGSQMVMDDSRIVEAIKGQPKPPDLVRNGRQIYEVYTDQQNNKRFIRSKSI